MSKFLEDIEQAGYAARYTDPKCRRFTYVTLTEKGKEFHGRFQTETHKEAKNYSILSFQTNSSWK